MAKANYRLALQYALGHAGHVSTAIAIATGDGSEDTHVLRFGVRLNNFHTTHITSVTPWPMWRQRGVTVCPWAVRDQGGQARSLGHTRYRSLHAFILASARPNLPLGHKRHRAPQVQMSGDAVAQGRRLWPNRSYGCRVHPWASPLMEQLKLARS